MHENNSSSRHVTKMGGWLRGWGTNTLSVTCPQGAKYAVTPEIKIIISDPMSKTQ